MSTGLPPLKFLIHLICCSLLVDGRLSFPPPHLIKSGWVEHKLDLIQLVDTRNDHHYFFFFIFLLFFLFFFFFFLFLFFFFFFFLMLAIIRLHLVKWMKMVGRIEKILIFHYMCLVNRIQKFFFFFVWETNKIEKWNGGK